ncbi:MAG: tetratricopeptide repeat protein [Opitutales bacterium]
MFYLGLAYSVGDGLEMNEDYAIRWIRAAAERELTMAQLTLGMKLALGDGVLKNLELAVQWLRRATLNGSAEAALQLRRYENILLRLDGNSDSFSDQEPINKIASKAINSTLNVDNRGKFAKSEEFPLQEDLKPSEINNFAPMNEPDSVEVAKQFIATGEDERAGLNLLEEAAQSGESEAMNELGLLAYKNQDYKKAMDWFIKAAEFNQSESLRYIGILYFLGQGVEIDYKIAEGWLEKAVKSGDIEASRYLRIVKQFR